MNQFQNHFQQIVRQSQLKKEEYGNKTNDLLKEMIIIDKEMKRWNFTKEYKKNNFKDLMIETEKTKRMNEDEQKQKEEEERQAEESIKHEEQTKRYNIVNKYLVEKEMMMIEKEMGRYVDKIIFNSDADKWTKNGHTFVTK